MNDNESDNTQQVPTEKCFTLEFEVTNASKDSNILSVGEGEALFIYFFFYFVVYS